MIINLKKKITEFRKFFSEHGDMRIPRKENTYELSMWVFRQRAEYRLGVLSQERIQKLESLEGWVWNRHDLSFKRGFAQIQKHVKDKKSLRIVRKYVDKDGFKLGNWIGTQRGNYKKGILSLDKIKQLESVEGWVWEYKKKK